MKEEFYDKIKEADKGHNGRKKGAEMEKILVVEDEWELNRGICCGLEKDGYQTCSAHTISEAKSTYVNEEIALILLDVNLPDGEGFAFCEWVKKRNPVPVLFLTARDLEEDALHGYELGAEDYITKPFSIKILLKKISIILNRGTADRDQIFDDGYLKIDIARAKVEADKKECVVTPTEFRLLQEFITHKGKLLTYEILLERLWDNGAQFVDKHTLAVNVNRLRGKIEDGQHKYISNVYGMGYQWLG